MFSISICKLPTNVGGENHGLHFLFRYMDKPVVERISLGSLRQSLRITVALSLILVLFSVGYGVPISQYVSMYSLIYYEQRSLRDRSTTR